MRLRHQPRNRRLPPSEILQLRSGFHEPTAGVQRVEHFTIPRSICILRRIPDLGADLAALFTKAKDWDYMPVGTLEFIED
jgi:hypothetical protein